MLSCHPGTQTLAFRRVGQVLYHRVYPILKTHPVEKKPGTVAALSACSPTELHSSPSVGTVLGNDSVPIN